MTHRNELHGLDSDGRPLSERGVTLPAVTAEATQTAQMGACPQQGRGDHDCATHAMPTATLVIDLEYVGQKILEDLLAAGESLPDGVTAETLAAWRAEHPDYDPAAPLGGQTLPDGIALRVGTCPAATGVPHDPAHPGRCPQDGQGVHRCSRTPGHHPGWGTAAGSSADHRCACGAVWASASGGVDAMTQQAIRMAEDSLARFARKVTAALTAHISDPEDLAATLNAVGRLTAGRLGEAS